MSTTIGATKYTVYYDPTLLAVTDASWVTTPYLSDNSPGDVLTGITSTSVLAGLVDLGSVQTVIGFWFAYQGVSDNLQLYYSLTGAAQTYEFIVINLPVAIPADLRVAPYVTFNARYVYAIFSPHVTYPYVTLSDFRIITSGTTVQSTDCSNEWTAIAGCNTTWTQGTASPTNGVWTPGTNAPTNGVWTDTPDCSTIWTPGAPCNTKWT